MLFREVARRRCDDRAFSHEQSGLDKNCSWLNARSSHRRRATSRNSMGSWRWRHGAA